MITPELLEQVENYLEWRCLDKKWFERRERLGKPINLRKLKCFAGADGIIDAALETHIRELQSGLIEARMGDDPLPITDAERAKMLETHRNYFANYLFALMEQKNLSDAEVAERAHVDAAIFSKLRNVRRYVPEERTIWALILGMRLTYDEANSLLHRTKFFLSAVIQAEVLMAFFLDKRIYDFATVNEIFAHYGLPILEVTEDFSIRPDEMPFRDESLAEQIDIYLDKNFREMMSVEEMSRRGAKFSISNKPLEPKVPKGSLKTFEVIIRKLKNKIGLAGSFFSDYLFKLIKQKNLTDIEVYKAAHLDRRVFSKIRNEVNYMPAKKTVMAIAFAMRLDITETNTLLATAGYFLSNGRKEDVIAKYFIDNQIYDLFLINEVLDYYGCPLIGD